jgi:hypothetical protein
MTPPRRDATPPTLPSLDQTVKVFTKGRHAVHRGEDRSMDASKEENGA